MLSLIPAILLLAFQGPSALERLGHEGRLPSALRALERALIAQSARAESDSKTPVKAVSTAEAKRVFAQLAALTSGPAFTAAIAQYLEGAGQTDLPSPPAAAPSLLDEPKAVLPTPPVTAGLSNGFIQNRRSRDGPR